MKRIIAFTTASVLAIAGAMPAFAESPDASGQADGTTTLPQTGATPLTPDITTPDVTLPDTGTTASTTATGGIDGAIQAINGSADAATQLGALTTVSTVNVIKLSELQGDNATELQAAIDANKANSTGVQAAIQSNAALSAKLQEQSIDVSSVVASTVEADGSVTVYVQ